MDVDTCEEHLIDTPHYLNRKGNQFKTPKEIMLVALRCRYNEHLPRAEPARYWNYGQAQQSVKMRNKIAPAGYL